MSNESTSAPSAETEAIIEGALEALKPLFYSEAFFLMPNELQDLFFEIAFKLGYAAGIAVYGTKQVDGVEQDWQERRRHVRTMLSKVEQRTGTATIDREAIEAAIADRRA